MQDFQAGSWRGWCRLLDGLLADRQWANHFRCSACFKMLGPYRRKTSKLRSIFSSIISQHVSTKLVGYSAGQPSDGGRSRWNYRSRMPGRRCGNQPTNQIAVVLDSKFIQQLSVKNYGFKFPLIIHLAHRYFGEFMAPGPRVRFRDGSGDSHAQSILLETFNGCQVRRPFFFVWKEFSTRNQFEIDDKSGFNSIDACRHGLSRRKKLQLRQQLDCFGKWADRKRTHQVFAIVVGGFINFIWQYWSI